MRNTKKADVKTIGVIGSGPSGAAAALTLLRAGHHVTMFDIGASFNSEHDKNFINNTNEALDLKTYMGGVFSYDINEFNKINLKNGEKKWFTSKGLGGFSTVWGATWKPFRSLSTPEWLNAFNEAESLVFGISDENRMATNMQKQLKISRGCTCFNYIATLNSETKETETNFWKIASSPSSLAVLDAKCDFKGSCQQGCDTGAIWDANQLIKLCNSFENYKYINRCFVQKISETESTVTLETSIGNFNVDYLILAAGPVATSIILLKSDPILKSIELKDTQMVLVPFFRLKRVPKHEGFFTLSGFDFNFVSKTSEEIQMHLQLYAHADRFLDRVKIRFNPFVHPFLDLLFWFLKRNLFIGILYVDSRWSGSLVIEANQVTTVKILKSDSLSIHHKEIRKALRNLRKHAGLWTIWKGMKIENVGDSYHLGFAQGDFIGPFGDLRNSVRIKVAGSIALKCLEPGPITMTAMAQAILTAKKLMTTLPKF